MARGRKTGGRERGTPNRVTVEIRSVCTALVSDSEYRSRLLERLRTG